MTKTRWFMYSLAVALTLMFGFNAVRADFLSVRVVAGAFALICGLMVPFCVPKGTRISTLLATTVGTAMVLAAVLVDRLDPGGSAYLAPASFGIGVHVGNIFRMCEFRSF